MASISASIPPLFLRSHIASLRPSSAILPFPSFLAPNPPIFSSIRAAAGAEGGGIGSRGARDPAVLRRPLVSSPPPPPPPQARDSPVITDEDAADGVAARGEEGRGEDEEWVDWEDLILQDTVPLVGFMRMILHSGKYENGDRISPEHEKTILERLLPYHPEFEKKIGCGIDFITIGLHPEFDNSRCLFIVRKDGELVDFSYWKCIKGLIRKNYPLYADSFILRHFRRRRHTE